MDRMREWARAIFFAVTATLAMEGASSLLRGRPADFDTMLVWAPIWAWYFLFSARQCARRRARAGA